MNDLFSVPAFFVLLRESVEACVVLSVMLRFLDKVGRPELTKHVWAGALAGLLIAIVVGVAFIIAFYVAAKHVFEGRAEMIFEGCMTFFACIVITVLAVSMLQIAKFQEAWERKLAARLLKAEAKGSSLAGSTLFWIPLTCILREGLEAVIFLAGVEAGYPVKSIPIPGITGLLTGFVIGYILYKAGDRAGVRMFLGFSTALLLFISAGLLARASREFQEAGMFGFYPMEGEEGLPGMMYLDERTTSIWNQPAWDICSCCDNEAQGWDLFRAIFGYTCSPSPAEIFFYLFYWVITLFYMSYKLRWGCFSKIGVDSATAAVKDVELVKQQQQVHSTKVSDSLSDSGSDIEAPVKEQAAQKA